jgi:hypothetical protein
MPLKELAESLRIAVDVLLEQVRIGRLDGPVGGIRRRAWLGKEACSTVLALRADPLPPAGGTARWPGQAVRRFRG